MRIARDRFIRLDDDHDRQAARGFGLQVAQEPLGNYPHERMTDVVVTAGRHEARGLIALLNRRACASRTREQRSRTTA
jgi:hypothetical protein